MSIFSRSTWVWLCAVAIALGAWIGPALAQNRPLCSSLPRGEQQSAREQGVCVDPPPATAGAAINRPCPNNLPDFIGTTYDDTARKLDSRFFRPRQQSKGSSRPSGEILAQTSQLMEGRLCWVTFVVSDGSWVVLPKFVGSESDARKKAGEVGLNLNIVPRPSEDAPPGFVIDQVPRPPRDVPRGFNVTVYVAQRVGIAVPLVVGSQFDAAAARLQPLRAVRHDSEGTEPAGEVIDQTPKPPTTLFRGDDVHLTVSDGSLVMVPDVRGAALTPARGKLEGVLRLRVEARDRPSDKALGTIFEQEPRNTTVRRGSTIVLGVSIGREVPSVMGLGKDEARKTLEKFRVKTAYGSSARPRDEVTEQDLKPPTRVAAGSVVTLTLSDNALAFVPSLQGKTLAEARQRLKDAGEFVVRVTSGPDQPDAVVAHQDVVDGPYKRSSTVTVTVTAPPMAAWIWYSLGTLGALAAGGLGVRWRMKINGEKDRSNHGLEKRLKYSARIDLDPTRATAIGGQEVLPRLAVRSRLEYGEANCRPTDGRDR